jgi:hypothetical protein
VLPRFGIKVIPYSADEYKIETLLSGHNFRQLGKTVLDPLDPGRRVQFAPGVTEGRHWLDGYDLMPLLFKPPGVNACAGSNIQDQTARFREQVQTARNFSTELTLS